MQEEDEKKKEKEKKEYAGLRFASTGSVPRRAFLIRK
jgi:hypothetical protein